MKIEAQAKKKKSFLFKKTYRMNKFNSYKRTRRYKVMSAWCCDLSLLENETMKLKCSTMNYQYF